MTTATVNFPSGQQMALNAAEMHPRVSARPLIVDSLYCEGNGHTVMKGLEMIAVH